MKCGPYQIWTDDLCLVEAALYTSWAKSPFAIQINRIIFQKKILQIYLQDLFSGGEGEIRTRGSILHTTTV